MNLRQIFPCTAKCVSAHRQPPAYLFVPQSSTCLDISTLFGPATYGILSYYICRSCAYAYLYRNERDSQSIQLQEMLARDGIEATASKVSGLDPQVAEEKLVLDLIVCAHRDICAQDPLENSN